MSVLVVFRPPFAFEPRIARLPEGLTLAEMAARMPGLPEDFAAHGAICIAGHQVPPALWGAVRPRATSAQGVRVEVTFHYPPRGGRQGGGKRILAVIASIALMAFSGGIATNGVKWLGIAGKTWQARALALGVGYVGSLAMAALSKPPAAPVTPAEERRETAASAQGNILEANGAIPRVIGERKVFPPFAAQPLTLFDGPDEVVEAVYALAGPHRLTDIRVGGADIASLGIEYETREGWPGDAPLTLTRRQGWTESVQAEVRGHLASEGDGATLDVSAGDQATALPQPYVVVTRRAPDEHLLQIAFGQGLFDQADSTRRLRVPLRLRMRQVGASTWINLPELHFQAAGVRPLRATIALDWTGTPAPAPSAANAEGFVEVRKACPGQTETPAGGAWTADPHFGSGGEDWQTASNLGSTGVMNVSADRYNVRFHLDPALFPKGRYEIEILRGAVFVAANYSPASYQVSGSVWDLFGYRGAGQIVHSRDGIGDTLYLLRSISIWHEPPIAAEGLALIAIRARNRQLDRVSVVAGGWVPDWDGSGWRQWVVTTNPAAHLRDVLAGPMNARPVPAAMVDDASLLAWRADGHSCTALVEGLSVGDAADLIAGSGYARPYWSEIYGVARDYDRSAEAPVQVFSPRNGAEFTWSKAFPVLPDGLRVTYFDAAEDYEERQIIVPRRGFVGAPQLLEQVTYLGPVTEAAARKRALYDLDQGRLRSTYYGLTAPAEAIVCRRGDLVGLQHDMLEEMAGEGRVVGWETDPDGDVTALLLDTTVPTSSEPDLLAVADLLSVPDVLALGRRSAVVLRGTSGPGMAIGILGAGGETDRLVLETPIAVAEIYEGALAIVGPAERCLLRLIVLDIQPAEDLQARLTLVPEANELHA